MRAWGSFNLVARSSCARSLSLARPCPSLSPVSSMSSQWAWRRYTAAPTPVTPPDIMLPLFKEVQASDLTQEAMLRPASAFTPLEDAFAVVYVSGHQYKLTKGDEFMIDRIDAPILSQLLLDKVLLVGTVTHTAIGTPMLPNAKVLVEVQEHSKTEKVLVFKKKKRARSTRKLKGHRSDYTLLKVLDIVVAKE